MKSKSISGKSTAEIKTAVHKSMSDGFKPTLAFVFISIKQDIDAVSDILDQQGIKIFGATTGGEFIDGNVGEGTIVILLLDMDPSCFMILLENYQDKDPVALAGEMAGQAKQQFKNPSFIISGSVYVKSEMERIIAEPVIRAIESVTGSETNIWGGRAGDDFLFDETIVFTNHRALKTGIIFLVLDGDEILMKGKAASGQKPVGTEKTITKATNNCIYEIDHQPAAEMVLKYLGLHLTQEEAEIFYPNENVIFSIARNKGEPVLRSVGFFDWKNKSVSVLASIKEGDKVRLTLPPDFEIIEEVSSNAAKAKQEEIPDAEALLMFSCIGRLAQFGPLVGDEIEGVRKVFNVPMAGFFTYGEFGRSTGGDNEFHNNTCCWVALKSKK